MIIIWISWYFYIKFIIFKKIIDRGCIKIDILNLNIEKIYYDKNNYGNYKNNWINKSFTERRYPFVSPPFVDLILDYFFEKILIKKFLNKIFYGYNITWFFCFVKDFSSQNSIEFDKQNFHCQCNNFFLKSVVIFSFYIFDSLYSIIYFCFRQLSY